MMRVAPVSRISPNVIWRDSLAWAELQRAAGAGRNSTTNCVLALTPTQGVGQDRAAQGKDLSYTRSSAATLWHGNEYLRVDPAARKSMRIVGTLSQEQLLS
ncbi:hypothetical protein QA639_35260 [Bradyrhizobium pachyrhizi]|uniref:hypothetical protein n=1 Tax=Bradyrhizobium pachyrhizi TaxID=280333 RepID=UPI0024B113AA|nr:hypothetical protein [Bradyrhizobium pachyrhizi]WFU54786.1 hypothetical protein QA639_35260 [Bradyrhizobium pachyrhizi]